MTAFPTRPVTDAPAIPHPRATEPELPAVHQAASDTVPGLTAATFPWPEPWRSARGARPRTDFWDLATASWRSSGPLLRPRSED